MAHDYAQKRSAIIEAVADFSPEEKRVLADKLAQAFGYQVAITFSWVDGQNVPHTHIAEKIITWLNGYRAHAYTVRSTAIT